MTKFKVGDRVRVLPGHGMGAFGVETGMVGTVNEYYSKCPFVRLPCAEHDIAFLEKHLEFVSPVRTVTRREIVPGEYGPVILYDDHSANVDCLRDASTARSAARIFNEIADVLEENA